MRNVLFKISMMLVMACYSVAVGAQEMFSVSVRVQNAKSNKGQMFLAIYNSKESFLNKTFVGKKSILTNKSCEVIFENIPEGQYAVSVFHDKNNNGKLDTNIFGMPTEDYGSSNNAKGFMGPPKWDDAKFELKNENKTVLISL